MLTDDICRKHLPTTLANYTCQLHLPTTLSNHPCRRTPKTKPRQNQDKTSTTRPAPTVLGLRFPVFSCVPPRSSGTSLNESKRAPQMNETENKQEEFVTKKDAPGRCPGGLVLLRFSELQSGLSLKIATQNRYSESLLKIVTHNRHPKSSPTTPNPNRYPQSSSTTLEICPIEPLVRHRPQDTPATVRQHPPTSATDFQTKITIDVAHYRRPFPSCTHRALIVRSSCTHRALTTPPQSSVGTTSKDELNHRREIDSRLPGENQNQTDYSPTPRKTRKPRHDCPARPRHKEQPRIRQKST